MALRELVKVESNRILIGVKEDLDVLFIFDPLFSLSLETTITQVMDLHSHTSGSVSSLMWISAVCGLGYCYLSIWQLLYHYFIRLLVEIYRILNSFIWENHEIPLIVFCHKLYALPRFFGMKRAQLVSLLDKLVH